MITQLGSEQHANTCLCSFLNGNHGGFMCKKMVFYSCTHSLLQCRQSVWLRAPLLTFSVCCHFCFESSSIADSVFTLSLADRSITTLIRFCVSCTLISLPLFSRLHTCSTEEPGSLSRTAEESGASKGERLKVQQFSCILSGLALLKLQEKKRL